MALLGTLAAAWRRCKPKAPPLRFVVRWVPIDSALKPRAYYCAQREQAKFVLSLLKHGSGGIAWLSEPITTGRIYRLHTRYRVEFYDGGQAVAKLWASRAAAWSLSLLWEATPGRQAKCYARAAGLRCCYCGARSYVPDVVCNNVQCIQRLHYQDLSAWRVRLGLEPPDDYMPF